MSEFSAHRAIEEAQERSEHGRSDPGMAIAAAIFAVLAALSTMLAHSRSTTALAEKNEAILAQAKATDQYNYYESKRIKFHLFNALLEAGLGDPAAHKRLQGDAAREAQAALPIQKRAAALEQKADRLQESSELALRAYETLEFAVTLFEVSIVFISISALARARFLVYVAMGSAGIGLIFFIKGLLAHF